MRFRWRTRKVARQCAAQTLPPHPGGQQGDRWLSKGACITAAAICIIALGMRRYPETLISGYATVTDGDSLEINGRRIRLHGIDAPEINQTCRKHSGQVYRCGEASAQELKRLVRLRKVLCKRSGTDRYLRFLGACWAQPILWGSLLDISAAMVSSGHAVVYRHFKGKGLAELLDKQATARKKKLGVWQGRFQDPGAWRNGH
ncbi:hypothetical protein CVIRNUC_006618 [Coccomyxa viridis]|uniref:TNase-like domain-containing protein n=1 Tax=Coccomyxa viridis TaxID=1274662 RepID=A0AAV1I7T8_9CHLO|nr:hypothetical protein CVIRNUC_006618 [Coccomyxa viridis]